jgi:hypothetical protein
MVAHMTPAGIAVAAFPFFVAALVYARARRRFGPHDAIMSATAVGAFTAYVAIAFVLICLTLGRAA